MADMWKKEPDRPGGTRGNFILPGPDNKIPVSLVRCSICNTLVIRGTLPMASHDSICGAKETMQMMQRIGDQLAEGLITEEQATAALRKALGV